MMKAMNKQSIQEIFKRFQKANPNPTTELVYHNPFELLIAVILSAQATDKSVNKATASLFRTANTPEKMLALGLTGLKTYIKSIGLYQTKAKNILKTCLLLIEKYEGRVPDSREALESLAGVGRKTANVVLNTYFGVPTMAVDTHIFRVANRIGLAQGTTPLAVEKQLLNNIPAKFLQNAHHWLILHGRYVCVARKPHCPDCLIRDLCEYPHKTKEE
jgi:endonuclease III